MRIILSLTITIITFLNCSGAVFTFQSSGDYTDPGNWDSYPGTTLFTNDTLIIDANCQNIDLTAFDGFIQFTENASEISILDLTIYSDCQVEFLSSYIIITISGYFFHFDYNPIDFPDGAYVTIFNDGYGIDFNSCPIWDYIFVDYWNFGYQDSFLLECMDGSFYNEGTINVQGGLFMLNVDLELGSGLIEGSSPYTIYPLNGTINQNCTNCNAIINNVEEIRLNQNSQILGTLQINSPE